MTTQHVSHIRPSNPEMHPFNALSWKYIVTLLCIYAMMARANFTCNTDNICQGTYYCQQGEPCYISCIGTEVCKDATFHCPVDAYCDIYCSGAGTCQYATLNCPNNHNCHISTQGVEATCQYCTVNGGNYSELTIDLDISSNRKWQLANSYVYGGNYSNLTINTGSQYGLHWAEIYCPTYGHCKFHGNFNKANQHLSSSRVFAHETTTLLYIESTGGLSLQAAQIHCPPSNIGSQNNCIIQVTGGMDSAEFYVTGGLTDITLDCLVTNCYGSDSSYWPKVFCGSSYQGSCTINLIDGTTDQWQYTDTNFVCYDTLSPTIDPIIDPTSNPTEPTLNPTTNLTTNPTSNPTKPTLNPTKPTTDPTSNPTTNPTSATNPTTTTYPTTNPTTNPTTDPTSNPTKPTLDPTTTPTVPTAIHTTPTTDPTSSHTNYPTSDSTKYPTSDPALSPTNYPTPSLTTPSPTKAHTGTQIGVILVIILIIAVFGVFVFLWRKRVLMHRLKYHKKLKEPLLSQPQSFHNTQGGIIANDDNNYNHIELDNITNIPQKSGYDDNDVVHSINEVETSKGYINYFIGQKLLIQVKKVLHVEATIIDIIDNAQFIVVKYENYNNKATEKLHVIDDENRIKPLEVMNDDDTIDDNTKDQNDDIEESVIKDDEYNECVVCMDKPPQYACSPCGHYCICKNCKDVINNKCPICMAKCTVMKIFK